MWQIIYIIAYSLLQFWKRRRKGFEEENGRLLRRRRLLIMRLLRQRRRKNVVKSCWAYPTTGRFWEETVPTYSNVDFLKHFRMGRETFQCLVNELYVDLVRENTIMRRAIPVDKRIAVALTVLKSSGDFLSVAKRFGIGKSTVHLILKEFSSAVCKTLYNKVVRFPTSKEEMEQIVSAFNDKWHFPGCVGVLETSHVPLLSPSRSAVDYMNSEGYHSVVVLGLIDHQFIFRSADIGQPGGNNDANIFLKSELYKYLSTKLIPEEFHLISGSSFPMQRWLMTPFPSNLSKDALHEKFDYHLNEASTPAEIAFAHLRGRWKILFKRCDLQLDNMIEVVKTCLVLHNLCESNGDHYFDYWDDNVTKEERKFPQPVQKEYMTSTSSEAVTKRDELAIMLY